MPTPIPFVLFGDAPGLTTGLGRIACDLAERLHAEQDTLGIALLHVGWHPDTPKSHATLGIDVSHRWPTWIFSDLTAWGRDALARAYFKTFGRQPGVVLTCWDPTRAYLATVEKDLLPAGTQKWGYFAIDGENRHGTVSGPAAEAVRRYTRVLAYSHYGSQVMQPHRGDVIPHLPHGIDLGVFHPLTVPPGVTMDKPLTVGCVATNQPRKDLAWFCAVIAAVKAAHPDLAAWLHTDTYEGGWSIHQLAEDYDLGRWVTVSTERTDADLAQQYAASTVTLAPGRGEGFGYPILESLACGVPSVVVNYAAGPELLPLAARDWAIAPDAYQMEGQAGLLRPVLSQGAVDAAVAVIDGLITRERQDPHELLTQCRSQATHYGWETLWPKWRVWVVEGLGGFGG